MAWWSGWIATMAILVAGAIPLGARLRLGKRPPPSASETRWHVVLGIVTSAFAFGHTLVVLPELGSPAATAGGMVAIAPAGVAFVLLIAHAGLGLQLRNEKLRGRAKTRRTHATTALLIAACVIVHIVVLERARR